MSRGQNVLALWYALLALSVAWHNAHAQAGSTGGTVGKTDKSMSGDTEPAPPASKPTPSRSSVAPPPAPRAGTASVAGRWHWTADCPSGHWEAGFQITEGMSGEIKGSLFSDPVNGTVSGQVSNGIISFTRSTMFFTQHWVGQLSDGGRHIANGSITGNETCTWEASRQ